ncbi:hypothetical protein D3C81_1065720 [compost metagenome]
MLVYVNELLNYGIILGTEAVQLRDIAEMLGEHHSFAPLDAIQEIPDFLDNIESLRPDLHLDPKHIFIMTIGKRPADELHIQLLSWIKKARGGRTRGLIPE